ncbi:TIGR02171 family protein [Fibrobacter sp. UWH5]|uniref:TIGR02171 family lipoprotein n=1 Tax=Fibrobacter sp. UWH5 TaxID=1896211 RepID=UPI00091D4BEF|nr:TIGR02171 family protein [Fibrobacter sp. UWH5]SHL45607.1 TIGR02171 family protein [Fibrobacter sp. UWH5]
MPHLLLCLFLSVVFFACSDSGSSSQIETPENLPQESYPGMVKVLASGLETVLGTNDENVPPRERPEMKVAFSYDFFMDEHEVTQQEFFSIMGWMPNVPEKGDSLPVVGVTYFDAVLFANAKSKSENLDTSYTYSQARFDSSGSCVGLDGLVFNASVQAYRLPTEAEWVYAASSSWNPDNGWNGTNSNHKLHPVCTKEKNRFALCDLEGNAMEWVNDWSGYFRDTTLVNYAGASDGGDLGERVVKGGYYSTLPENMSLFSRGDVYTVLAANKYNYVGFRLVLGNIPNAVWTNANGSVVMSKINQLSSLSVLKKLTGTFNMKLVFRNDLSGHLNYVDYNNANFTVTEIADSMDVYHPTISPDGKYVAFCTKYESVSGTSDLYVRPLDETGKAVKLDVRSAAIPRWRVIDGDTVIVYVTDAGNNENENAWKASSTWKVSFRNGSFGVPQKIFDGAFNGGVNSEGTFAVSGSKLLRSRKIDSGKTLDSVWYGGNQACNVSLSMDGSNRTLFLDFAGSTGVEFVGEKYRTHERLLIADLSGNLIQTVKSPEGFTFDHTEWVGDRNLVIATLTNNNGNHQRIALINPVDSSIVPLISGDELWHPDFWIKPMSTAEMESKLDLDSAGVYYVENGSDAAAVLRAKMEIFWRYKDSINTVVLGSSRPSTCVDPMYFSDDIFAINMSTVPNITGVSKYLLKNYLFNHSPNLKNIVISLDIDLWYRSERFVEDYFFREEYKNYPGFVYDANHDFWKDGYPKGLLESTESCVYNSYEQKRHSFHRGVQNENVNLGWEGDNPGVDVDSNFFDFRHEDYVMNFNNIIEIIEMAANRGINVVGVVFPQSPGYKNTGAFGRYGLRRSDSEKILKELQDLENIYDNYKFMDENKMGGHDYPDSMAVNRDHLRAIAAPVMTARVDSVLHSF